MCSVHCDLGKTIQKETCRKCTSNGSVYMDKHSMFFVYRCVCYTVFYLITCKAHL